MSALLTVLGAGSILPRAGYGCAGYALRPVPGGPVTLLDCGPGSVRQLGAVGIELREVRRVVLSHFHPDHCLDLLALAFARRNPRFADAPPLELVGPAGLRGLLDGLAGAHPRFGRWIDPLARDRGEGGPGAELLEVEPGRADGVLALGDLRLGWVATGHTPEALAWRVETSAGETLVYSGDSGEAPEVAELARGVDLFLCECSFPEELAVPGHLTPAGAGRLAARAGCRTLLLTHFYPEMDPDRARGEAARAFGGRVETARDGSRHPLRPAAPELAE